MVCRTAYLISVPDIEEVNEREEVVYNTKTGKFERHHEQFLFPVYRVYWSYDYGMCCGIDGNSETFGSREEAQAAIDSVLANEHSWIKYDPKYLEDDDEV